MNLDLYSDEFRNFKYLKSNPDLVAYFKIARAAANQIQPWANDFNPEFNWPCRLEFVEQLIDLRNDTAFIVFAGMLSTNSNEYESANLIELNNPIILTSNPLVFASAREVTLEDIPHIESVANKHYCLCSGNSLIDSENLRFDITGRILKLNTLPIVPHSKTDFTEIFYDKTAAEGYRKALTDFLRNKLNAISALASRF